MIGRFPWILIYTIQEKVSCSIASLFKHLNNSFQCIFTVEARLKKLWIKVDEKPERLQNAETSVSWHDLDEQKF